MTDKVDFKKTLDAYRATAGSFRVVDVPPTRYLMIDGHGDPNGPSFQRAIAALYPVAYRLKFASKAQGRDYVVMPLEALWSASDVAAFTSRRDKSQWHWTALIMVPDWTTPVHVTSAVDAVAAGDAPSRLGDVRLETLDEGRCVQTLHLGAFDDEGPTLARLHDEFIPAHGFAVAGRHHEIYLSDLRRVEPAKLRTILRQPVTLAG